MKKEYMIPESVVVDMVLKNSLLVGSEKLDKTDEETNEVQSGFFFDDDEEEEW